MFLKDTSQSQNPLIVMVSTPYTPDGLFDSIEKQPEETCIKNVCIRLYLFPLPSHSRKVPRPVCLKLEYVNHIIQKSKFAC